MNDLQFYGLVFLVGFVVFMLVFYIAGAFKTKDGRIGGCVVSILIGCMISLVAFDANHSCEIRIKNCKEIQPLKIPTVVYANDSSFKSLHFNQDQKIILEKSDSLFHFNDSEYLVEPCESKIILKKRK